MYNHFPEDGTSFLFKFIFKDPDDPATYPYVHNSGLVGSQRPNNLGDSPQKPGKYRGLAEL